MGNRSVALTCVPKGPAFSFLNYWSSVVDDRPDRPSRAGRRIVPDVCGECSSKITHCSKVHGPYHVPPSHHRPRQLYSAAGSRFIEVIGFEVLGSEVLCSEVLGFEVLDSEVLGFGVLGFEVLGFEVLGFQKTRL